MYGLEKNQPGFEFDLEKSIKKDPGKATALLKTCEQTINELKGSLREGSKGPELGTLMNGYTALGKIIRNLQVKKK
jgi:hypothetical protein